MTDIAQQGAPSAVASPIRNRGFSLAIHVALCAASLVMLYPLLWMLASSFKPENEIFGSISILPTRFEFASYLRGWKGLQISFGRFFWNSLLISALCVIGNVMSCSLTAYAFARLRFRGKNLIPQYILFLNLDWVDTILPLVVPKYLASDAFFIFLMVQFFRGIPRELDEAAMMDGCSPWRIYHKIILPLSLPVLATAAIFTFIFTWDDFFAPLVYLNDMGSYTVQLGLRAFVDSSGKSDWGALFAMSVLALVPVLAFFLFCQRLLIEGVATTGLKR